MKIGMTLVGIVVGMLMATAGYAQAPAGSTGTCKDGSYTSAATKRGACAGHGGVKDWYSTAPAATAAPAAKAAAPAAPAAAAPAAPAPAAKAAAPMAPAAAAPAAPAAKSAAAPMAPAAGAGPGQVWVN